MTRYRKRSLEIEAVQFTDPYQWIIGICYCPDGSDTPIRGTPHVHTLNGIVSISVGDWIITGIQDEQYPCKPDIFKATYEQVVEQEETE